MRSKVLEPVGVELTELSVGLLGADDVPALRSLLAAHGVIVLPGQQIDDQAFLDFLQLFGSLAFTKGEPPLDGFPDLNTISNVGRATPPRSSFHVDTSYVREPPAYTALRAVRIPEQGGETLFSNQYKAFETLPKDVRDLLTGRTIKHVVTGLDLDDDEETEADHPVFRRHPISGLTSLYLSSSARCVAISGLTDSAAAEMVEFLLAHSTREENVYRHTWRPDDLVMWDNGCVLHRADHSDVVGDRVMHRGMVAGYGVDDAAERPAA